MSSLLMLRVLDAPRFLNRTSTDSIFAFRLRFLRETAPDEVLELATDGKRDVVRVPIPRSAAAIFDSVAGITGIAVEDLYSAMISTSADALASELATTKH